MSACGECQRWRLRIQHARSDLAALAYKAQGSNPARASAARAAIPAARALVAEQLEHLAAHEANCTHEFAGG